MWARLPRIQNVSVPQIVFHANTKRAGEYVLALERTMFAESVIGGVLNEGSAEGSLRAEISGRDPAIDSGVVSLRGFQRIVALVADIGEPGHSYASGQGE